MIRYVVGYDHNLLSPRPYTVFRVEHYSVSGDSYVFLLEPLMRKCEDNLTTWNLVDFDYNGDPCSGDYLVSQGAGSLKPITEKEITNLTGFSVEEVSRKGDPYRTPAEGG